MELPTTRELELEVLLRQRDVQVSELSDEVTRLRQYLTTQASPSTTDPVTLPPAFVSVLLPHIQNASGTGNTMSDSSTVTSALIQRVRLLQEENDELYGVLKYGETAKLKEENNGLRGIVGRLEAALRESHQAIKSLSKELEQSYENFTTFARQHNAMKTYPHSDHNSYKSMSAGNGNGTTKQPPTGPRAHKKPRLSEPQTSPPPRSNASAPSYKSSQNQFNSYRQYDSRPRSPRSFSDSRKYRPSKSDIDRDSRARPRVSGENKDRDRDDRESGGRDRGRDTRERERNQTSKHGSVSTPTRSGAGPPASRRPDRSSASSYPHGSNDRTLAERMGL